MRRGFLAAALLLAALPFLTSSLASANEASSGLLAAKNTVLLHQRAVEEKYSLENGFENAVRKGLAESAGLDAASKSVAVCEKIREWLPQNVSFYAGYVSPNNYEPDEALTSALRIKQASVDAITGNAKQIFTDSYGFIEPCLKFVEANATAAAIRVNRNIEYVGSPAVTNDRIAFVLKKQFLGNSITALIPEGRVIESAGFS